MVIRTLILNGVWPTEPGGFKCVVFIFQPEDTHTEPFGGTRILSTEFPYRSIKQDCQSKQKQVHWRELPFHTIIIGCKHLHHCSRMIFQFINGPIARLDVHSLSWSVMLPSDCFSWWKSGLVDWWFSTIFEERTSPDTILTRHILTRSLRFFIG